MIDFYPDIYEYLDSTDNTRSVSSKDLDELIYKVRAATGLDYDIASNLVRYFFQEIRNSMLKGDIVTLRGLGKFMVSSPINTGNKQNIFAKFEPYKQFSEKLNERQ